MTISTAPSSQKMLRQHFRAQRKQLSKSQQEQASLALLANCKKISAVNQATNIACYLANDGEINPKPVIDWCWQQGKTVLLPIIHPTQPGQLLFIKYLSNSSMRPNQYGIAEPDYLTANVVALTNIDIILTPLVAFDSTGNRLGMGGGYYDRTLAPLSTFEHSTQVLGLAHECQYTEQLPTQTWDIPLQGIITDQQIFMF